jgi:hypothetical protein
VEYLCFLASLGCLGQVTGAVLINLSRFSLALLFGCAVPPALFFWANQHSHVALFFRGNVQPFQNRLGPKGIARVNPRPSHSIVWPLGRQPSLLKNCLQASGRFPLVPAANLFR